MRRKHLLAAAVAAAALAAPAAAQADSIAYIKNHNIWIAEPDGSRAHQVTRDGTASWAYRSPSQADNGTIVAAHGTDIVRLKQNGQVLAKFDPPDTTDSAGQAIGGHPSQVAVSPDGTKIAYSYYQANCPPGVSCGTRYTTLYSHADRATPPETFGRNHLNNPSWVSNQRLLAFGGFLRQVNYDSPGGGSNDAVHWFDDADLFGVEDSTDLGDGELSRQGDRFAALRGYGAGTHLMLYKVTQDVISGTPSGPPAYACNTGNEATLDSPTWSPDGKAIAFAHKDGVEVIPLPSVEPDCPGARSGTVVIPGGSEPDWGPAPVNPGPPPDDREPDCCPPVDEATAFAASAPKRVRLGSLLRNGLTVTVVAPGAGKATATAVLKGTRLARRSIRTTSAGTAKVKLRFGRKAARTLRAKRTRVLTLRAAFTPQGGAAQSQRLNVRVIR